MTDLVERLREVGRDGVWKSGRNPKTAHPMCIKAADRIEALSAENERLIKSGDGDVGLIHWQGERIEKLEAALREIARLRTDLSGDFSLGSKQSDIARAALGETK